MHTKSLTEIAADLRAKRYSSREIVRHYLDRIAAHDGKLNSYVTVCGEQALAEADAADAKLAAGEGGPLTGVPIAHKDIFCTEGVRTACGSRMLDSFIAPYSATLVERLRDAGAVMLGKLNMDEFAMGSSNETSYYGPVPIPADRFASPRR